MAYDRGKNSSFDDSKSLDTFYINSIRISLWLVYQLEIFRMSENSFSKIDRPVDHRLLLLAFKYTRYDRLCGDPVASTRKFTKLLFKNYIYK